MASCNRTRLGVFSLSFFSLLQPSVSQNALLFHYPPRPSLPASSGIGGTCDRFSPPAGFWCSTTVQGGGSTIYYVPIAMNVTTNELPNTPYKNGSSAIVQVGGKGDLISRVFMGMVMMRSLAAPVSSIITHFVFSLAKDVAPRPLGVMDVRGGLRHVQRCHKGDQLYLLQGGLPGLPGGGPGGGFREYSWVF